MDVRSPVAARLPAAAAGSVGLAAFALYAATLAPTVTFVDSGELLVVASELGVAHPPGMPLYTLLAHVATWLPIGSVATRVHLLSAAGGAAAAAMATWLFLEILRTRQAGAGVSPRGRKGPRVSTGARFDAAGEAGLAIVVPAVTAGLLLAVSRTLWAYATVAEVYTIASAVLLAGLAMIVRWRRGAIEIEAARHPADAGVSVRHGWLFAAAAVLGAGLGVHYVMVGLITPACAVLVWSVARRSPLGGRVWATAIAIGAAGLLSYAYLPLAAAAAPLINWGDPDSWGRFWSHVTGRQYQVFLTPSLDVMIGQFGGTFVPFVLREFGPRVLPLALAVAAVGLLRQWRSDRPVAAALALVIVATVGYALNYDIDEDQDAYYLPAFLVLPVAAGLGVAAIVRRAGARGLRLAIACAVLLPAIALAANLRYDNKRQYHLARDYVTDLLQTVEPGGLLLTLDWQVYSPWLYLRHVEGLRPDAVVVDVNLLRRSWYFDYLARVYPALVAGARPAIDAYLEDLQAWEADPDRFQRDAGLNRRINERFHAAILDMISAHRARHAAYITLDLLTIDRDMAALLSRFTPVPQGLVFALRDDRTFVEPAAPAFAMRGLFDGTLAFAPDDVVRMKVAPVYLGMLVNRGRYLAAHGQSDRAATLYREALSLDPAYAPAQASLAALGR